MNGCVYRTADNQCQKYSDPIRNTMSWCVGNEPCEGRTPSNADRIRAMTDKELAEWLGKETIFCCDRDRDCRYEPCEPCLLRWLKSPVEVDE